MTRAWKGNPWKACEVCRARHHPDRHCAGEPPAARPEPPRRTRAVLPPSWKRYGG